jgi:hypothetical protein
MNFKISGNYLNIKDKLKNKMFKHIIIFIAIIFLAKTFESKIKAETKYANNQQMSLNNAQESVNAAILSTNPNKLGIKSIFIGDTLKTNIGVPAMKIKCSLDFDLDKHEITTLNLKNIRAENYKSCYASDLVKIGGLQTSISINVFDNKIYRINLLEQQDLKKYSNNTSLSERSKLKNENETILLDALKLHFGVPVIEKKLCRGGGCRRIGRGTYVTQYTWQGQHDNAVLEFSTGGGYNLVISSSEGYLLYAARNAELSKLYTERYMRKELQQQQQKQFKDSKAVSDAVRDLGSRGR